MLIREDLGNSFADSLWQIYNYHGAIIVLFSWAFGLISETTLSEWQMRVIAISLSAVIYFLVMLFLGRFYGKIKNRRPEFKTGEAQTEQRHINRAILITLTALVVGGSFVLAMIYKTTLPPRQQNSNPIQTVTTTASDDIMKTYHIQDLGLEFAFLPALSDLTHEVARFNSDQAVNSVGFSTVRLDAAGCSWQNLQGAPLGYLRFGNDQGGVLVAHARFSDLYYIRPKVSCDANPSLQNWQLLQNSLRSLVSDYN